MRRRSILIIATIDISSAIVTASNQTYNGSYKQPTPTVTLYGEVIPSSGYNVSYSNNINAGTATITVTGKEKYIGSANGTFTINKVTPTVTAPSAKSLTYNGGSQTLAYAGSTNYGTLQYSSDNSTWSTTIPAGTNASTSYYVYYRVVGDSNVNDVAATYITCSISKKSLSITASNQTITYGSYISNSTNYVTTSGLVNGDSLTSITLTPSTSYVTSSGKITPSNAATTKGISNYSVSYYQGNLTITQATGSISFATNSLGVSYNPYDTTANFRVSASGSGWDKTTAKTVSGYNVFRSYSNKGQHYTASVIKFTFVNNTGAAVTTNVKVGPATERSCDYVYIATWNASDITSYSVPSSILYTGSGNTAEWTDVSITIPTGTNTLQVVYRKDQSVSNSPDCGYFALPYDVNIPSMKANSISAKTNTSISYSSSNTGVASVNSSTGTLTINGTGSATIYASAAATTEYSSCSAQYSISVSAYKVAPTYTAPTANNTTYNGSSQYLTTNGSTSHGTIYYSLDGSSWYSSRRTGTTAGSYTSYWKLTGDAYHTDVSSTSITTTISKANRTISFTSAPSSLNVGSTATLSASPSAGSGDGTITYSTSNSSVASISGSTLTGVGAGTCTITATISEGTNYSSASTSFTLNCISPAQTYLIFTATQSGTFKFTNSINYSLDNGNTWTTLASNTDSPTVSAGNKIMWKATLTPTSSAGIGTFSSTGNFTAEGNVMSLLYGDNSIGQTDLTGKGYAFRCLFSGCTGVTSAENMSLPATTLSESCYLRMFSNCTSLTTAPTLPATTLAQNCYNNMFYGCTSLITAPELPATTLANTCYANMFSGCTGLTTAPSVLPATTLAIGCCQSMFQGCKSLTTAPSVLPATTLIQSCYNSMFMGCISLTTAPELPATTLANTCYANMFRSCKSLNSIKCLATNISASGCLTNWVNGVASSGTFTKASSMTRWTTGASGIPSGWTVQDA